MDLPYLAERLYNRPLLVTETYAEIVQTVLADRMGVAPLLDAAAIDKPTRRPFGPAFADGVLTIPIVGGLYHRGTAIDAMSGSNSYTNLENVLSGALRDGWTTYEGDKPKANMVKGVLLDIDSPGGEASGCFEFADTLRSLAGTVPIWAVANASCMSAAYAIAASCSRVLATPSAMVGSIGAVMLHTDLTAALEKRGAKVTVIRSAAWKMAGSPYEPLPEAVRADFQAKIGQANDKFIDLVASRRPMSATAIRATEARVYGAEQAQALGLVDEVATYEQARSRLVAEVNRKVNVKIINGVPVTWQS